MKLKFFILLFLSSITWANAQELKCNVQINSDKIQGTNKSVFKDLQQNITQFINERKWTDLVFEEEERIECSINLIINSVDGNDFSGELLVQSRRPVFNSNYPTTLINFKDNGINFTYNEFDQLEFTPSNLSSNLTAILAYYAYLIIGYDMDTFSRWGGTPYFQAAESIVTQAQSTSWSGWRAFDNNRNRYAVVSNLMDEAFRKFREYNYQYHRLGLDEMSFNATNGRAKIANGFELLREANRARPNAVIITMFLDAKNDELINIFKQGSREEKEKMIENLTAINPAMTNRYEQINQK